MGNPEESKYMFLDEISNLQKNFNEAITLLKSTLTNFDPIIKVEMSKTIP